MLSTPLMREGIPVGTIHIRRIEVLPFTEKQIKLLETFADQAVIAIENVRLFNELQSRNRDLTEALEQQTATSEILRVIASSPTDIQPVLDVVAENAARLCDAKDAVISRINGEVLERVAIYGTIPVPEPNRIDRASPLGRAVVDRQTIHVPDLAAEIETEFPESKRRQQISGARSVLAAPLLREGVPIGAIFIRRTEVRPFSQKQIALLKTFADQAVIAIENVRLFQELQARNRDLSEALEQQTATSEILRVIASSPTDVQPVLDVVAENAARLCDASNALIYSVVGDRLQMVGQHGPVPALRACYPSVAACRRRERSSTAKRFTFMTCRQREPSSQSLWLSNSLRARGLFLSLHCCGKVYLSGLLRFAASRSVLSLTSRSLFSKPLLTRR
jgi:GAF domain-containing protein